jgi:O-antigen/teichoic acid export membrane protein
MRLGVRLRSPLVFAVATLFSSGAQWLWFPVLARSRGAEDVGALALALAITLPTMLLANARMRTLLVADTRGEFSLADYLSVRVPVACLAVVVAAAIGWSFSSSADTRAVVCGVAALKGVDALSDIFQGFFQVRRRLERSSASLAIRCAATLAVFALSLYAGCTTARAVAHAALASFSVLVLYDAASARALGAPLDPRPAWRSGKTRILLRRCGETAGVQTLISIYSQLPTLLLARTGGESMAGVFAPVLHVTVLPAMILGSLADATITPLAAALDRDDMRAFARRLGRLGALAAVLGGGLVVFGVTCGPSTIAWIYGNHAYGDARVVALVCTNGALAMLLASVGTGIVAWRQQWRFVLPYLAMCAVSAAICLGFIPSLGPVGAAWANVVGNGVGVVLLGLSLGRLAYARREARRSHPAGGVVLAS